MPHSSSINLMITTVDVVYSGGVQQKKFFIGVAKLADAQDLKDYLPSRNPSNNWGFLLFLHRNFCAIAQICPPKKDRYTPLTSCTQCTTLSSSTVVTHPRKNQTNKTMNHNQGTLEDRYDIYVECLKSLGASDDEIKSFDEWLNS